MGVDKHFSWQVPGWAGLWLRGARAGSWSTVGSIARTEFSGLLPKTCGVGGHLPGHLVDRAGGKTGL